MAVSAEIEKARDLVDEANENIEAIKAAREKVLKEADISAYAFNNIKAAAKEMSSASGIVVAALWADSINTYE